MLSLASRCSLAVILAAIGVGTASAQGVVVYPAPVVSYYTPAPVVSYYAPAPAVSYYAPAPVVSYYAPAVAPVVSYYAPAPAVSYYAPAPAITRTTYFGPLGRPRAVSYGYIP